jgi:diaminopimelate decarboxylase
VKHASFTPEDRPPAFSYREIRRGLLRRRAGTILCCEQIPLPKLAERYGTPLYVYSAGAIRERLRVFDRAFHRVPHTVCYSAKANSSLAILRLLDGLGCGFDVVSGGELQRVLTVDRRAARRVVFSGVGKTADEMLLALRAGIFLFNVESEAELWKLAECAARLRKQARIALRVNPDVPAETHPYIATGLHQHKFGVPIAEARKLYASASAARYLRVAGVSMHIGSQITSPEPFAEAMARVAELVRQLRDDRHSIDCVDAGGGLGIWYEGAEPPPFSEVVAAYAGAVIRPLRGLKVRLLLEPGRAIVGPAGALITAVVYRKRTQEKRFIVTDAAMNDLLRPSLYGAYHEIVPVRLRDDVPNLKFDVVGPICETGDFFARDRQMPDIDEGELLAILDTGAYGMVLASNYNTRPKTAEVMVDGSSVKLIRRRESFQDLIRQEAL